MTTSRRQTSKADIRRGPARRRPGSQEPAREHVGEIQRRRILAATAEVAAEQGAPSTTVAHIVARAGVSRRTFYNLFQDRHECFVAVFDEAVEHATLLVSAASEGERNWVARTRAGLLALLTYMDEEHDLARMCVVQALSGSPELLRHRAEVLDRLMRPVDAGRLEGRGAKAPILAAEGVVGAVFSVIHTRLTAHPRPSRDGDPDTGPVPLTDLLGSLMGIIVLPYLGPAAAAREQARPLPKVVELARGPQGSKNPLEGLDMRLTYRTMRVLAAIGAQPGISNRDASRLAGVSDQGQISKLMLRLEGLGLIENTGEGQSRGSTNAWHLTARGTEIQSVTRSAVEA